MSTPDPPRAATLGARAAAAVDRAPTAVLAGRLTLVLAVLNTNEDRPLFLLAVVLLAVAFPRPSLAASGWLWLGFGAVVAIRQLAHWEGVDNHVIVTTYWMLALGLALLSPDPQRALRVNGRLLIGLVFAFAAFWKVASPTFTDGTFFHYTLLLDDRFRWVADWVAGLSGSADRANLEAVASLRAGVPGVTAVPLSSPTPIPPLAAVMTGWGLVVEALVAAAFLLPDRLAARITPSLPPSPGLPPRWLARARHGGMVTFCLTTYVVVPIGGFGALLGVLGVAMAGDREPAARRFYVVLVAALVVYTPLWRVTLGAA